MKLIIIGDKENNQIKASSIYKSYNSTFESKTAASKTAAFSGSNLFSLPSFDFFGNKVSSIIGLFSFGSKDTKKEIIKKQIET